MKRYRLLGDMMEAGNEEGDPLRELELAYTTVINYSLYCILLLLSTYLVTEYCEAQGRDGLCFRLRT